MLSKDFWQRFIPHRKAADANQNPCFWKVDIHSHLIPSLDDGVNTLDDTLTCLTQLANWGIQKVITTPHVSRDWYPNSTADIRAGLTTLQTLIAEHQLTPDRRGSRRVPAGRFFHGSPGRRRPAGLWRQTLPAD